MQHQAVCESHNPDPMHITAHYLYSSIPGPFEVNLRVLKDGRATTNLTAEFIQKGQTRITVQMLFSKLGPAFPATSHTRRIPLREHPSTAPLRALDNTLPFHVTKANEFFQLSAEPEIAAWNEDHARGKGNTAAGDDTEAPPPRFGGGGLFWGGWYTLKDEEDKMTLPMYAILGDVLLGRDDHDASRGLLDNWHPTLTISIEFMSALPPTAARRTVGAFNSGSFFLNAPNKRHNTTIELWSAPCNLGDSEFSETSGWRDEQVCLAVATQTAMIVPVPDPRKRDIKL
ncbi:hypothetical protein CYLTODRAFT_491833 [Cylindrobasidium torrendii FP15055 ss-10]|uniref:Acyl-CoA thioesterase-like N-terminal HotDog domain-containing protein n=1 Tax=Cylindrobasidium torrendii FP15055 ss-10 TaxID=1314674 RepID=A0A0D7B6Z2_9AGAR|nr:hypothetical protein CYLTODRAFT_491833 [Cylindrobasidium torrendii FP15055 ss-10]